MQPAEEAAGDLLAVLQGLLPGDTGCLLGYKGLTLPFRANFQAFQRPCAMVAGAGSY